MRNVRLVHILACINSLSENLLRLLLGKVTDANTPDLTLLYEGLHRLPGFLDRNVNYVQTLIRRIN